MAYETKVVGTRIDKRVNMKYFNEKQKGQIDIEFDEKSIPFEFKLVGETQTYGGTYEMSGSFEEGEILLLFMSLDGKELWKDTFKSGVIKKKQLFDAYWGEYILRMEFNNAKKGNLEFKVRIY
jgi:hypothetical protein